MQKAIFITGAAKGIGRATALLFAKNDWFVGAYDVDEAGVKDLQKTIGNGHTHTGKLDVTDFEMFKRTVADFEKASGGRMDALFNNAGVLKMGFFEEIPIQETKRQVDINIMGVVNGIYASVPLLEKTPGATIVKAKVGLHPAVHVGSSELARGA